MRKRSILHLEDEPTARRELTERIERKHFDVLSAESGTRAVEIAKKHRIGLLLADIKMPRPDGIDAARMIQRMHPDIPVVFVTAYSDKARYKRRVVEDDLNVADWIPKPVLRSEFSRIESVASRVIDLHLLRDMVNEWTKCGWSLPQALAGAESAARVLRISKDVICELRADFGAGQSPKRAVEDVEQALNEVQASFDSIEDRQLAFGTMKELVLSQLDTAFTHTDQDTRRMALVLRMAVRNMSGLELTPAQLDALEVALGKLRNDEVSSRDRRECRWRFRRAGIETMISLGPKTRELIEIYDEFDEDQEDTL